MKDQPLSILLNIDAGPEADEEEVADLTRQLREELEELDLDAIGHVRSGETPAGAKGDPLTLGTLLVTLAAQGGVLTTLISQIQSWLPRHGRGAVTLEIGGDKISVTTASSEQQQQLIDAFVSRHLGQ